VLTAYSASRNSKYRIRRSSLVVNGALGAMAHESHSLVCEVWMTECRSQTYEGLHGLLCSSSAVVLERRVKHKVSFLSNEENRTGT